MTEPIPEQISENETKATNYYQRSISEKISINKSTYNILIRGIVVAIAIATFLGGYQLGTMDALSNGDSSDLIVEAEGKSLAIQPTQVQPTTQSPSLVKVSLDDDPMKGNPQASITIIEFSDFQCPFCKKFYDQTLPLLDDYISSGKVKFVYRDLPLRIHANAQPAHIGAECADEQGRFWEYHDILFQNQEKWEGLSLEQSTLKFEEYASQLNLDKSRFSTCMKSSEIAQEVNNDVADAIRLGVTGTPTFFIGNEKSGFVKLVGAQPFSALQSQIESFQK